MPAKGITSLRPVPLEKGNDELKGHDAQQAQDKVPEPGLFAAGSPPSSTPSQFNPKEMKKMEDLELHAKKAFPHDPVRGVVILTGPNAFRIPKPTKENPNPGLQDSSGARYVAQRNPDFLNTLARLALTITDKNPPITQTYATPDDDESSDDDNAPCVYGAGNEISTADPYTTVLSSTGGIAYARHSGSKAYSNHYATAIADGPDTIATADFASISRSYNGGTARAYDTSTARAYDSTSRAVAIRSEARAEALAAGARASGVSGSILYGVSGSHLEGVSGTIVTSQAGAFLNGEMQTVDLENHVIP